MDNILTNCIVCGKKLTKKQKKTCSRRCFYIQQDKKIIISCSFCGKKGKWKREFCSHKCYWESLKGKRISVKTEFKKGNIPINKGKKMSPEKYAKLEKAGFFEPKYGEKSANWKGGITMTKEKLKERHRYYRQNPEYKLKHRIYQSKRWALKKSTADNTVTKKNIDKLFITQNNKCNLCDKELNEFHIDHIVPLSKKGKHTIKNIQLLCPRCNMIKSDH